MSTPMQRICDARDAMTGAVDDMEKLLESLSAARFSGPLITEWRARGKSATEAEEMAERAYVKYTKLLAALTLAVRTARQVEQEIEAQRLVIKRTAPDTSFVID
jgi:hypothetical protein